MSDEPSSLNSLDAALLCLRCGKPFQSEDPHQAYCSRAHQRDSARQLRALREAGPGCSRCFRGCILFEWRPEGGRQRMPALRLTQLHAAPCTCTAGQRITLPGGYKTWGYMRDYSPEGALELAPNRSWVTRARLARQENTGEKAGMPPALPAGDPAEPE